MIYLFLVCHCQKFAHELKCEGSHISLTYACGVMCEKLLECGNHVCRNLCHPGACEPCSLAPGKMTTCCCGKTPFPDTRKTCVDPIPVCGQICSKNLNCGPPGEYFKKIHGMPDKI